MKKYILSAALLTFVFSSTLTSCSSDDDKATSNIEVPSEPEVPTEPEVPAEPETPVTQTPNTVDFNGTEFPISDSYYELVITNYGTEQGPIIYDYPAEAGGGYANAYYINLENEDSTIGHYALMLVKNPTIVIEGDMIMDFGDTILPNQTEDIFWANAFVLLNGTQYYSEQGNTGTGSVTINALDLNDTFEGTTDVISQYTKNTNNFNFVYTGNTYLTTYLETQGRSAARLSQIQVLKQNNLNKIQDLAVKNLKK